MVYIVSVHRGRVCLLGKMRVGAVGFCADLYLRWVGREPEPALAYLIADEATPARLVQLPTALVERLRFRRGRQDGGLTLQEDGRVDRQSLRSVRRLTDASAEALDQLLPAMVSLPRHDLQSSSLAVVPKVSACQYCALQGRQLLCWPC
jgi:hypothetical protein